MKNREKYNEKRRVSAQRRRRGNNLLPAKDAFTAFNVTDQINAKKRRTSFSNHMMPTNGVEFTGMGGGSTTISLTPFYFVPSLPSMIPHLQGNHINASAAL